MQSVCENCIFFVRHYYKDKYGRFILLETSGHCKHPTLNLKSASKIYKTHSQCEFFQAEKAEEKTDKNEVLDKLKHAKLLLSDIMRLLNND